MNAEEAFLLFKVSAFFRMVPLAIYGTFLQQNGHGMLYLKLWFQCDLLNVTKVCLIIATECFSQLNAFYAIPMPLS